MWLFPTFDCIHGQDVTYTRKIELSVFGRVVPVQMRYTVLIPVGAVLVALCFSSMCANIHYKLLTGLAYCYED